VTLVWGTAGMGMGQDVGMWTRVEPGKAAEQAAGFTAGVGRVVMAARDGLPQGM